MKLRIPAGVRMLAALTLLVGVAYPLAVLGVAQAAFPWRANGSLVEKGGRAIGSELLGQAFGERTHFWARPSASGYATVGAGPSNLAPTDPKLRALAAARAEAWKGAFGGDAPGEMLYSSGSGLDPHISPEAALAQVPAVAAARKLGPGAEAALRGLVGSLAERPLVGPPVVDVLVLNERMDSDAAFGAPEGK